MVYSRNSIIRTSIIRISRLSGLFLWSQFGYEYLLVTIKIRSHILFKTTALKGAVKCKGFLLSKSRGSARACRKVGLNYIGIFGFGNFLASGFRFSYQIIAVFRFHYPMWFLGFPILRVTEVFGFGRIFWQFWMIFSSVLRFLILSYPNVPLRK